MGNKKHVESGLRFRRLQTAVFLDGFVASYGAESPPVSTSSRPTSGSIGRVSVSTS